ncbi:unnamed protein product [Aphanomyces euteiches]|nr:hypothetical protein LEN26_017124 [Aphanomyces euteiches]KAH9128249.1 hypothetical protein AeMF1_001574 [Aphanomyces euteiches]KAH9155926.1 hypothetical protein AeRB84_002158 [Aphanomyces euteiches]KAH9194266.1 hypothetical protein AeNC1_003742 [Aphanomyces euteiches]
MALHHPVAEVHDSTKTKPVKQRKVGVPKFLRYLFQILECEDPTIISWAGDGTSIQILDMAAVATVVLPKYFKHSNYASFQRQLNYFGFRKWTKSQTNICTFSHPEFTKHRPDRMCYIKRKNRPERINARRNIPKTLASAFPAWPSDPSTPMAATNAMRHTPFQVDVKVPMAGHPNMTPRQPFLHQDVPPLHPTNMSQLMEQVHFIHTPMHHYHRSAVAMFDQNNSRQLNQMPQPSDASSIWYY